MESEWFWAKVGGNGAIQLSRARRGHLDEFRVIVMEEGDYDALTERKGTKEVMEAQEKQGEAETMAMFNKLSADSVIDRNQALQEENTRLAARCKALEAIMAEPCSLDKSARTRIVELEEALEKITAAKCTGQPVCAPLQEIQKLAVDVLIKERAALSQPEEE